MPIYRTDTFLVEDYALKNIRPDFVTSILVGNDFKVATHISKA